MNSVQCFRLHEYFDGKKRMATHTSLPHFSCELESGCDSGSIKGGSMKLKKVLSAMSLGVLLFVGIAYAQYTPQVIKVNVPFSFEVYGQSFPAGTYSLLRDEPNILRLRDANGRSRATILTGSVVANTAPTTAKLDFRNQGGRHVLARVWQENNPYGYELYSGKPVQFLAKRGNAQQATVEGP